MATTIVELLHAASDRYGDSPALTSQVGLRSRTWSYDRVRGSANCVAGYLREECGLAPGSAVVFWAHNSPELVTALFGAMTARLVVVPLDPSGTRDFVERVVTMTRAELIVSPFPAAAELGPPSARLTELPVDEVRGDRSDLPTPGDIAEVVFTSGTTGEPKGVVLQHSNITYDVEGVRRLVPDRPLSLISLLPLSHMFEQTVGLYGALSIGSRIHYPSSRKAPVITKAMRRHQVSAIVAVPQVLELMLNDIEREVLRSGRQRGWEMTHRSSGHLPEQVRRMLFARVHRSLGGHLRYLICGGAPLPRALAGVWERMGVRVIEGYGTTECAPVVAANTYEDRRPGSVGRPLPGVAVEVTADGEILVKGPNVFSGYWEAPVATEHAIDPDGWYHTGDLGVIDDDGYLRITGRKSDRIVLASGLDVYPADVEGELLRERAVAGCVVVPVVDDAGNSRLHAVMIPAVDDAGRTASTADVEAAVRRAAQRLAPHQRPTGWSIWSEPDFPRTNLRKIKRYAVESAVKADQVTPESMAEPGTADSGTRGRLISLLGELGRTDPQRIEPNSALTLDVGLDSLGLLSLATALEDEFGVVLDDGDLVEVATVEDLYGLINRHDGSTPGPPPPRWPRSRWARAVRAAAQRTVVFPVHATLARPFRIEGAEVVRELASPVLMVANHCSHADTPSILRALPVHTRRRTTVAAAVDYFYRSKLVGTVTSLVLGTFPFSREGAVRSSLEHCGELIDDGWSILLYPEGTRSTTGQMASFRRGIGLLATQLGVPVLPIAVTGTYHAWPKGQRFPRPAAITVRFGAPVRPEPGDDPDSVVRSIEHAVARLVG